MRKIIFLDIDGVLNTKYWYSQMDRNTPKDKYGYMFDPVSVDNLEKIIKRTEAGIVISSSWRFMGLSVMLDMWEERKLPGRVIDVTPNSFSDDLLLTTDLDNDDIMDIRGQEIKEWLMRRGADVSNYVILDDMNDILQEQENNFVWIDPEIGITTWNAEQAIQILNN